MMVRNDKLLTIVIPQHKEDESLLVRLLVSINNQVGIDFSTIDIKIIGDGGYRLNENFLHSFDHLNISYLYYAEAHGPGYARQFGLEQSFSRYIAYMDADDELNTVNALWQFVNIIHTTGDHQVIFSRYVEEHQPDIDGRKQYTLREFNPSAAYGKWLNIDFLREYGLYWHPELQHAYEDTFFLDLVLTCATDVYYLDVPTYTWLYHDNSIVRTTVDYNQKYLDQYVLEGRLWIKEISQRYPDRERFDVNNGLINIYNFYKQHPPLIDIEEQFFNEVKQYVIENADKINLRYAAQMYAEQQSQSVVQSFITFWQEQVSGLLRFKEGSGQKVLKKTLSVIIPVSSETSYIMMPLLLSINNQVQMPLNQIEILIIQDGQVMKDVDNLKTLFPKLDIRLYQTPHQMGPGPARSLGIHQANGEFVMFCDADDQVHTVNAFAKMCRQLLKYPDTDILMAKYVNEQYNQKQIVLALWDYNYGAVYPSWYRRTFLQSRGLDFHLNLHSYYEDTFFVGITMRTASRVTYSDEVIYTHRLNPNSLIHQNLTVRQSNFLVEFCRENYYWFQAAHKRFPQSLQSDIDNFVVSLYYMYESYQLYSIEVDNRMLLITKKIMLENEDYWRGWTPALQKKADNRKTGDAENISSQQLFKFIQKFMVK